MARSVAQTPTVQIVFSARQAAMTCWGVLSVVCGAPLLALVYTTYPIPVLNERLFVRHSEEAPLTPDEEERYKRYLERGNRGVSEQRLDESIEASVTAIGIEPRSAAAWNNLGFAFALQGRYEAAEAALIRATRLDPRFQLAHNNLAWVRKERATGRPGTGVSPIEGSPE